MAEEKKGKKVKTVKTIAVSGGFDPLHVGHVRMFKEARKLGDRLVVILNNDNWLLNKKGFVFMPEDERVEVIRSFPFVDEVVLTDHKIADADRSVVKALRALKPDTFVNGGDRKPDGDPIPEVMLCEEFGIDIVYNIGFGGKVQSSSWMIGKASRDIRRSVRPWGEFYNWDAGEKWNLKTIYVKPKKRLSLQYHKKRSELWVLIEGDATATIGQKGEKLKKVPLKLGELFNVGKGDIHRIESRKGGIIVEMAQGKFEENDIVRLEDDHGRVK